MGPRWAWRANAPLPLWYLQTLQEFSPSLILSDPFSRVVLVLRSLSLLPPGLVTIGCTLFGAILYKPRHHPALQTLKARSKAATLLTCLADCVHLCTSQMTFTSLATVWCFWLFINLSWVELLPCWLVSTFIILLFLVFLLSTCQFIFADCFFNF